MIVLQRVEVDHEPVDTGPELSVPDVLDAAAVGSVVQHRGGDESRALQVDDQPGRIGQREVLYVTAPRSSITTSTLPAAGSTLTALTSPSRGVAPLIPGLAPGVSTSRNGTRAAMRFMALPPAWRATDSPAARSRTPAP